MENFLTPNISNIQLSLYQAFSPVARFNHIKDTRRKMVDIINVDIIIYNNIYNLINCNLLAYRPREPSIRVGCLRPIS